MSVFLVASSLLCGGLFVGAGLVVAVTVKRVWFPAWRGSLAVTAVVLVWLGWALALCQLLGAFGLLRRMALLVGAVLTAGLAVALARRAPSRDLGEPECGEPGVPERDLSEPEPEPVPVKPDGWESRALTVATVLLVLFVAAIWVARTVIALHRGINDPDSLGYHVPMAVIFAHTGYADQHRVLIPLLPVQYFPANDELLSAAALALTHSLAFAAAKNLLFGALVEVAAHALGKAFGAARLAMAATAIVLGCPVIAFSQPGEAVNDALLLLLLVGGLAVLAHARTRPAPYVLALACAGLALGVKFSGIVPAALLAALAVALLLARVTRHRWRGAAAGLLASAALGGSWYVRNAINYGNPIPPVKVAVGPVHLHAVVGMNYRLSYSVAHYALHGQLLGVFARGVVRGLGPAVVATSLLCLTGVVGGLAARDGFLRGLSIAAVIALLGYVVTPASAFGMPKEVPLTFVINLHYGAPAYLMAMIAGAIVLRRWRWAFVVPVVGLVAVATSISRGQAYAIWSPEMGGLGFAILLVAVLGAGVIVLIRTTPSFPRSATLETAAVAVGVVAAVGVLIIAGLYPSRRSTDPLVAWAATVPGARIAEWNGNIADLYGPRAGNDVVIISRVVDDAALPIETCRVWMSRLRDGHFQYAAVIVGSPWAKWMQADPAFRMVVDEEAGATVADLVNFRRGFTVVYQIVGTPNVSCPGQ